MELKETQISREEIFKGKVLNVVKDKVLLPDGRTSYREFCLHNGAVAVLPLLEDGRVAMVKQFRYAHQRIFLEIPAGKLDSKDEPPKDAAKRELKEETGAVAKTLTHIATVDTTPALINERIEVYLAEGLEFGENDLDEGEFLNMELIPLSELVDMVMKNEIKDSKTQIAVLKVAKMKGL